MEKYIEVYFLKNAGYVILIPAEKTEENIRKSVAMGVGELIEYLGGLRGIQDVRDSMLRIDKVKFQDKHNFTMNYKFHTNWGQIEIIVEFNQFSKPKARWGSEGIYGDSYSDWEEIISIATLPYYSVIDILGGML